MWANGFIKTLSSKMFKDIQRIMGMNWARYICLSKSIRTRYRTDWKIVELI